MSTIYSVPREKRYGKYKKVLYLEPPFDGAVTVKRRVTTIVPPPQPPPPRPAPVLVLPRPEPVHVHVPNVIDVAPPVHFPEPQVEPDSPIDVIAVDIEPSEAGSTKSSRTSKSYKSSRSGKRHSHSRDREVYIERERVVPVPVRVPVPYPVQAEPQYDTFRYIEAPRRYEPRHQSPDREIIIEDHRRRRYIRD
ncbi:hypothetical protein E0Z10_g9383 [Xylaria hypoxylon]|uniref:Uncharacterized protein n=1 Tax=Xylaria hypoxylon TaxID=37992 RepID=A0A4Z0YSD7_9PEZI|nr:hypothetical protein E0Z10_g9383 [Xylaria hypoxylon]